MNPTAARQRLIDDALMTTLLQFAILEDLQGCVCREQLAAVLRATLEGLVSQFVRQRVEPSNN